MSRTSPFASYQTTRDITVRIPTKTSFISPGGDWRRNDEAAASFCSVVGSPASMRCNRSRRNGRSGRDNRRPSENFDPL
jgi:hypothetical protein